MTCCALLIVGLLAAAPEFEVQTAERAQSGRLTQLSAERVALLTTTGEVTLPTSQILAIQPRSAPAIKAEAPTAWVETLDGSLLYARQYAADGERATIALVDGQQLAISTRRIARVRFRAPQPETAAQWDEIARVGRTSDLIVLRKQNALDHLSGALGVVTADSVQFTSDGEKFDVKRAKLEGLAYALPANVEQPAAFCMVQHASGSVANVAQAELDGDVIKLVTPAGLALRWPLDTLVAIKFKATYLSDLKPEAVRHAPFVSLDGSASATAAKFYRPRMDMGWNDEPLRLGTRLYSKGLAIAAQTELNYRLPDAFGKLQATVGIEPSRTERGRVRLVVTGDDRILYDEVIAGREPRPLLVELTGVRRLKILVDFAGNEVGDRVILGDARLLK